MDRAEDGVDVEVQHLVELVRVAIHEIARDIGPGIGVEDVELAGARQDGRHHAGDALRVEEIDDERNRPVRADLAAHRVEGCRRAIDEKDGRARLDAGLRAGQPDAGCSAGDGNHLAGQ
jgi:hypothetical protein